MPVIVIGLIIVAIDQFTKYLVLHTMVPGQSIPVIESIFHITYIKNYGAAFGILQHQTVFFIAATIAVVALLSYLYIRIGKNERLLTLAFSLQIGGAFGNLIDRLRFTYVIDFFDFQIWPVFNIADMAIVCGVAILGIRLLRSPELLR